MPNTRRRAPSLSVDPNSAQRSSSPSPSSFHRSSSPLRPFTTAQTTSFSSSKLRLQVLDVSSSAVALSVFTPRSSSRSPSKPPSISIQLDRRPWPHVAHAGSSTGTAPTAADGAGDGDENGAETTVIVYGLDPSREYEISLEVVEGQEDSESVDGEAPTIATRAAVEVETGAEASSSQLADAAPDSASGTHSRSHSLTLHHRSSSSSDLDPSLSVPDGPPPPYSPAASTPLSNAIASSSSADHLDTSDSPASSSSSPSGVLDEPALRTALKTLRATSKRTESSLIASISSLRKAVEKAAKEDQRARTRIGSLEEAIRKAADAEDRMKGEERESVEDRKKELERIEEEARKELEEWREGKREVALPTPQPATPVREREGLDDEDPGDEGQQEPVAMGESLPELAKELDSLNKAIEAADQQREEKANDVLKNIEREMQVVEGELMQLDREEAHRMYLASRGYGLPPMVNGDPSLIALHPGAVPIPVVPIPVAVQPQSGGPFGFRWRRGGGGGGGAAVAPPPPPAQPPQADPRSFGRFFRRGNSSTSIPTVGNSSSSSINVTTLPSSATGESPPLASSSVHDPLVPSQIQQQQQQQHPAPLPAGTSDRIVAQQQFAQAHQAQAMWALQQAQLGGPVTLVPSSGSSSRGYSGGVLQPGRSRAGSLNQQHAPAAFAGVIGSGGGVTRSASSSPLLAAAQPPPPAIGASGLGSGSGSGSRSEASSMKGKGKETANGDAAAASTELVASPDETVLSRSPAASLHSLSSSTKSGASTLSTASKWGSKLGTWSQVVGRGAKKAVGAGGKGKGDDEGEGSEGEGEEAGGGGSDEE